MNAINAATNAAHFDWHAAGQPANFEQAYSQSGFHFWVRITNADGPWMTTVFWVSRQGNDLTTDVVNFEQPLYDCVLEQSSGCDHPINRKGHAATHEVGDGPDQKANLELLDQAIQQVLYAVIDVGCYDDESEILTYHTEQLESAPAGHHPGEEKPTRQRQRQRLSARQGGLMTPVQHNVASRHINRHRRRQHGPETPPRVGPNSPTADRRLAHSRLRSASNIGDQ